MTTKIVIAKMENGYIEKARMLKVENFSYVLDRKVEKEAANVFSKSLAFEN